MNHQYDKSASFLLLAQQYVTSFLKSNVIVKSELSELWELQISRIFCEEYNLRKFHPLFLSCNEPSEKVCTLNILEENRLKRLGGENRNKIVEIETPKIGKMNKSRREIKNASTRKSDHRISIIDSSAGESGISDLIATDAAIGINVDKRYNRINNIIEMNGESGVLSVEIIEVAKNTNSGLKIGIPVTHCEWCCKCEKCAFIFLLLSAWLPSKGTHPLSPFLFFPILLLSSLILSY